MALSDAWDKLTRLFGPVTADSRAGRMPSSYGELRQAAPDAFLSPTMRAILDYGPMPAKVAVELAKQPVRAGESVGDFLIDPSLGRATKAGADTALALLQPARAAKIMLGGLGLAAAREGVDAAIPGLSAADPLDAASRARLKALQDKQAKGATLTKAEREEQNSYLSILADSAKAEAQAKAKKDEADALAKTEDRRQKAEIANKEYERQVLAAEAARSAERAKDIRFNDTRFGRFFNESGGVPVWAATLALGAGGLDRIAKGAAKTGWDYARQGLEGSGAAMLAYNGPLAFDAFSTPTRNPQKDAARAYAQELPQTHPERGRWEDIARNLPDANPVRTTAQDEFYDPWKFAKRTAGAILEGVPGALSGANLPEIGGALKRGAGSAVQGFGAIPGQLMTGYQNGMGQAAIAAGNAARARQAAAQQQAAAASEEQLLAEALRRSGGRTAGPQTIVGDLGAVRPGAPPPQLPPALPPQPQLPLPPAGPAQNPPPPPQLPQGGNSVLSIPATVKPNGLYADQNSGRLQQYVLDKLEKEGIAPSGLNKAQAARDINTNSTRASDAINNLLKIAKENGLDVTDPAVLRRIITELNSNPKYKRGTGNTLFGAPAVMLPFGLPDTSPSDLY